VNGFILIDKPQGKTSFYITSSVRRALNIKKAGHLGTLDPMATGLLPVMVGNATKIADLLPDDKKRYTTEMLLGTTTDTLDITGKITSESPVFASIEEIKKSINSFGGEIKQIPPMYSAISINGKRLYELAREGKEIERKERNATIFEINILRIENKSIKLDITCSKGTYIRTLIDDIGKKLNCGAVMTALRRTESNGFDIKNAVILENIDKNKIIPVESIFCDCEKVNITDKQAIRFKNGGELDLDRLTVKQKNGLVRVYNNNCFLGLSEIDIMINCVKVKWQNIV